jgi:hypothetical protein
VSVVVTADVDRAESGPGVDDAADSPATTSGRARRVVVAVVQLLMVTVAALASLALRREVPLVPNTSAYDGLLFARLARSMMAGDWLGPFQQLTLAKGPGFPFFLAVTHWVGLELTTAEQLVHLAASAAVALAILVTTRRRWVAVLAFTFLALDPSNFGLNSSDVMRDNLFASLGVLALALGFLTTVGVVRRSRWVWVLLGSVSTGVVLAGYWLTREEGVTILPPLIVTVAVVAMSAWGTARAAARRDGTTLRPSRALLLRAAAALVVVGVTTVYPLHAVRSLNEGRYGAAVLNDQGEGTFLRAYADWSRVEAGPRLARIPISVEQRRAVYAVSQAARELRSDLEDPGNQWRYFGCAHPETSVCDFAGGWMVWAIRDAAVKTGNFADARSGQQFFARLSEQISVACEDGRLRCARALPASLQGLQRAPTGQLAENFVGMLRDTVRAHDLYETATELGDVPQEVRAVYAPVVRGLPLSVRAAEAQMTQFQDRRELYGTLAAVYRVLVPLLTLAGVAGLAVSLYRTVRRRPRVRLLPALALGLAVGVLVRAALLALIQTADFDVVARYLLPGYAMLICFAVVGAAAGLPARGPDAAPAGEVTGSPPPSGRRWLSRRRRQDPGPPPSG